MSKNPNQKLKLLYTKSCCSERMRTINSPQMNCVRHSSAAALPLNAKAFIRTSKHSRILVWM